MSAKVSFTAMEHGTQADYELLSNFHEDETATMAERVLGWLQPYVSEKNHWIIRHHGLFQGYYYFHFYGQDRNVRDQYRDHPHYEACVDFCANWDQVSFDPDYDTLPLEHFEPMLHRLFARAAQPLY